MKEKKNYLAILIILLISLLMSGCAVPFFSGNEPVYIISKPVKVAIVGNLYVYRVVVEDDGKTELTFSLTAAPEGMEINRGTGLINWTPTAEQAGKHEVGIMVRDGWYTDIQNYSLTVSDKQLNSITVSPSNMSFTKAGEIQTIGIVTAKYNDGSSKTLDKADCIFVSNNPSIATVDAAGRVTSKTTSGSTTIAVSYTDNGITKSANINVSITKKPTTGG